jgi:hypothetical protein
MSPKVYGGVLAILLGLILVVSAAQPAVQLHAGPPGPGESGSTAFVAEVEERLALEEGFLAAPMEPAAATMTETFEGAWPSAGWQLSDQSSVDDGEYLWGKRDCHPHSGSYAGWSVGGGAAGSQLPCSGNYPNNADVWAVYGPFDLRSARSASLTFYYWGHTEYESNCNYDLFYVGSSLDGIDFLGNRYCGDWTVGPESNGYYRGTLDLTSRSGQGQVWVAFVLDTDSSVTYEGITIDDVTLNVDAGATPTPTGTPTPTPTQTPTLTPTPMVCISSSQHPYEPNRTQTWIVTSPSGGAHRTLVHFPLIELADGDYITLSDRTGNIYHRIAGTHPFGLWARAVPGPEVRIQLAANSAARAWGFCADRTVGFAVVYLPLVLQMSSLSSVNLDGVGQPADTTPDLAAGAP